MLPGFFCSPLASTPGHPAPGLFVSGNRQTVDKHRPAGDPRPGASGKLKEIPGAPHAVHGPQSSPGRPLFGVARLRAVLKHSADVSAVQLCEEAAALLEACREHLPGAQAHLWPDDDAPWSRHP